MYHQDNAKVYYQHLLIRYFEATPACESQYWSSGL